MPGHLHPGSDAHLFRGHCDAHERDQGSSCPAHRFDLADVVFFFQFLKQANGLDLGKLLAAYYVYYKVRRGPTCPFVTAHTRRRSFTTRSASPKPPSSSTSSWSLLPSTSSGRTSSSVDLRRRSSSPVVRLPLSSKVSRADALPFPAFYGSFIDCLVAVPLGALLVLVQVVVSRNDLYSSLFE